MATSPFNRNRLFNGGKNFSRGVNSFSDPEDVELGQVPWAINLINSGGDLTTRPPYQVLVRFPDGRAQGMTVFTPNGSEPVIVSAVSGKIYVSQYPYTSYMQLTSIGFSADVDHIFFEVAVQSANSAGEPIPPQPVLLIQDGRTRAAYYDGSFARHLIPGGSSNETVIGTFMVWVSDRLWVMRGRQIFASDIRNPLSFTENIYIAGGNSLFTDDGAVITGASATGDNRNLLVWSAKNTSMIQASITDRSQWGSTQGFVSLLFPGVGCVSHKSITRNNGELRWFSNEGVRFFSQVGATIQTAFNPVSSIEMKRSFDNLSPIQSRICAFTFKTYSGWSVPSGDVYNRHTWVVDNAPKDLLGSDSAPAWQGVWTGTRPVQWATETVRGKERCFFLSQDYCGIRLWEAFTESISENGGRIYASAELPARPGDNDFSLQQYKFSEYHMRRLKGTVSFTAEWRGNFGCWKENAALNLCAEYCRETPDCADLGKTLQPQNRYFRTQEAQEGCDGDEGPFEDRRGFFFQNRVTWWGQASLARFRMQIIQREESTVGECATGDAQCKELLCCDEEFTYRSHVDDGYNYPSTTTQESCSL